MSIKDVAQKYADYQLEMRRWFHQHPELSTNEENTSRKVQEELTAHGVEWRKCGTEGYGILATVKGAKPGKTVLLRGDMDALLVTETTGLPYASENEGVMHACGHDCHISTLLVAACILNDMRDELCGEVRFAFQPAEEVASGAGWMIADGAMDGVDGCFATHVWGGVEAGKFICEPGPRMGAVRKFEIKVTGVAGHGAQPETCVDSVVVGAQIVNNLQTLVSRRYAPTAPLVLTVGSFHSGTSWNIIAGEATLTGTTRCLDTEIYNDLPVAMEKMVTDVAAAYGATVEYVDTEMIPPTINDAGMAELARAAGEKVMGDGAAINLPPTMGGEDFSRYIECAPGAIMLVGVENAECDAVYANHHDKFTVDESVLLETAMIYAQVAVDFNSQN